jgi:hypothetical protein
MPSVSKTGDLWIAEPHHILCANALHVASYETLLCGQKARLVVTDPPYNVPIAGHVGGKGAVQHRDFAMAFGEMTIDQFRLFLATVAAFLATFSIDGSLHYFFMDWRHTAEMLAAGSATYSELKNIGPNTTMAAFPEATPIARRCSGCWTMSAPARSRIADSCLGWL